MNKTDKYIIGVCIYFGLNILFLIICCIRGNKKNKESKTIENPKSPPPPPPKPDIQTYDLESLTDF